MVQTKLILIEGLPGTGKSTTSQKLAIYLSECGYDVEVYHEEKDHHPIHEWEIEEINEFKKKTLMNWKQFVEKQINDQQIIILESTLLQSTVRLLLAMGASDDELVAYALDVEKIIQPLNPILIYLYQEDVEEALNEVFQQRGASWEAYVHDYIKSTEFAKNINNENPTFSFFKKFRKLSDHLVNLYQMKKVTFKVHHNYENLQNQLIEALELPHMSLPSVKLEQYVGNYKFEDRICRIYLQKEQLIIDDFLWQPKVLLPIKQNLFYIMGYCIELVFDVSGFLVSGDYEFKSSNTYWNKVE